VNVAGYAILGTGAVGGYYGALLQKAGREVHFLLRSDFETVRREGLRVDSPRGDFRLPKVNAYARAADMPACDVAVVAWKTTENRHLREALPGLVKPGGAVLVLQNGLDPEREAAAAAPSAEVISGLCFLCSRKDGPGWIRHQDYGAVTFAAFGENGGVTPRVREVGEDFRAAGVETRLIENWRAARWRKLVWNAPFNGLCALHGVDTRALLADPELRALARSIMFEVTAGAAAAGCPLPEDFPDRMIKDTEAMIAYEPSMKLDRDAGRPMELEAIYGRTLEAIRLAGGKAERIGELFAALESIEKRSEL
jgi:2-dehydropantoate 2-reductase